MASRPMASSRGGAVQLAAAATGRIAAHRWTPTTITAFSKFSFWKSPIAGHDTRAIGANIFVECFDDGLLLFLICSGRKNLFSFCMYGRFFVRFEKMRYRSIMTRIFFRQISEFGKSLFFYENICVLKLNQFEYYEISKITWIFLETNRYY